MILINIFTWHAYRILMAVQYILTLVIPSTATLSSIFAHVEVLVYLLTVHTIDLV